MFPLPYRYPFQWLLYTLFILELSLLAGGLIFGKLNEDRTGRLPRPLRMLLSALLVLAALLGWQGAIDTPVRTYALLIFLGMTAGFVGDLIMAELIPVPNRLIFGMIEFGIGHLFYIAAFVHLGFKSLFSQMTAHLIGLLIAVLTFCVWAWYNYVRNPGGRKTINIGSLVYGLLIGVMVALAVALAIGDVHYIPLALGAWLFLASDFILGNWVIRGHAWKSVNDAIWIAYVCGQLLIVYSVAAAINTWQ